MMNLNKLSRAGEKIRLSDDAKKRIIAACTQKLPDNAGEYTDIVMTVERYKPRPFRRFAAIAAVCVLAVGGLGAGIFAVNKLAPKPDKNSPGAAAEEYTGKAVREPFEMKYTHMTQFFWNKCSGNGRPLSDAQLEKLYDLFNGITYTELDDYNVVQPTTHFLEYTRDNNDYYEDGYYIACLYDDTIVLDEKSTFQPKANNKQCYRLSENITEQFDEICCSPFSLVLDNEFFCLAEGDISKAGQSEIADYLRGLNYSDVYTSEEPSAASGSCADLNFSCAEYDCKLHIFGNYLTYTIDFTDPNAKKQHIEERVIASGCDDAAATVLGIYNRSKTSPADLSAQYNEDIKALTDVFRNRDKYVLSWADNSEYTLYNAYVYRHSGLIEASGEQYAAVAELMNGLEFTGGYLEDAPETSDGNSFMLRYWDRENPAILRHILISGGNIRTEHGWIKTGRPELYREIKDIFVTE